jgi:3-deoxy-D-manno-octulosonic-acid transferase
VRYLYSLVLILLAPLALLRLGWRGFRHRGYWARIGERFGRAPVFTAPVIWIHAVSVGEARAAAPLVRALRQRYPDHPLLVTTMTPTGADTVRALFGETVRHAYAPYDLPGVVQLFLSRARPSLAIIMETEIWPNLFAACSARRIPLAIANVRLSEKSARGYARFAGLTHEALACVSAFGAQAEADAARLVALGADEKKVHVTGSLKFEVQLPDGIAERAHALRAQWGLVRRVWVAGSTREGEEPLVLATHALLRKQFPDLLLVLVPRHPERFDAVARMCQKAGFVTERRSALSGSLPAECEVLVGDTMGELMLFYAAADVAFVGGSLLPLGGQNPLEACAVGTPVVFGPHTFNFTDIVRIVREHGAGVAVAGHEALAPAIAGYLADPVARNAAGSAGRELIRANRGALARTLSLVEHVMHESAAPPPRVP